jgi:polysaccharide pyruvyl transferase WcaK-like protein
VKLLRLVFKRLPMEALHWLKAYRTIRGFDVLIVPGTQVVSDYLCGPLAWPYDIFKWSMVATARGVRLVFLSVGVGPVTHPLSRWFIRKSLQRAVYRSYRDEISMQCARSLGVDTSRDAVCPDLAFGLQDDVAPLEAAAPPGPGVIGIGLKDRGVLGDQRAAAAYHDYLRNMATFTQWLCRRGYRVRLLLGDIQYDTPVGEDFTALLRERLNDSELKLIVAGPAHSLKELVLQLTSTDAVVSPRFHSLLLAAVLGKPSIALSDHFKIDMLMEGLGIPEYTMSLKTLDADSLIRRFQSLLGDAERVRAQIRASVTRSRLAAYAQYSEIFSRFGSDGASPAAYRTPQTDQQT